MRMRKKRWARPELAACPYFIADPEAHRGQWRALFARPEQPMQLELGCGKGVSTAQMVHADKSVNFVAIDLISDVLGSARRNIAREYGEEPVDNVILTAKNILTISEAFSPEDRFERIYISFPNPWDEKLKHRKRRLTHPRQLLQYRDFLADGGEIWFKTDHDGLFDDSLEYFAQCGFAIRYCTRDLHASGFAPNYLSEHEIMFSEQGLKIKFLIAAKEALPCATPPSATSSATENT